MESRAMPASLAAWKILPSTSMLTALVHSSRRAYFGLESGGRAGEAVDPPLLVTWSGPHPPPLGAQFLLGPPNSTAFPLKEAPGSMHAEPLLSLCLGLGEQPLTYGRTCGPCRSSASRPLTERPSSHTRPPNLGRGQGGSVQFNKGPGPLGMVGVVGMVRRGWGTRDSGR